MQPYSPSTEHDQRRGITAALGGFIIWGFMPLFWRLMVELPAIEIMCQRVVWLFLFLCFYLIAKQRLGYALALFKHKKNTLSLLLSGGLLTANWLLYIWAINTGHVLESSLGYYINPLLNVFLGRLLFREKISPLGAVAICLAIIGVGYQVYQIHRIPWVALGLAGTFALYGLARKLVQVEALNGIFIETSLYLPLALAYILWGVHTGQSLLFSNGKPELWVYCILTGPLTAFPLVWFTFAARRINLTTLGLLQYLTPSMIFLQGYFLFNEPLNQAQIITFGCIWTALALYSCDGYLGHKHKELIKKAH